MNATDALIRRILALHHGAATRAQLLEAGVTRHVLDSRVRRGRLVAVHRTIYRLADPAPCIRTLAAAALLATTRGVHADVAISHAGAAALLGYGGDDPEPPLDVSGRAPRRVTGIRVHRVNLCDDEVTTADGLPVTAPARTVLDLAGTGTMRELEQALAAAERAGMPRDAVRNLLRRRTCHRGSGRLRQLLDALDEAGRAPLFLRSRAEALAVRLVNRARLPAPLANERVAGHEVDLVWLAQRLVLEVDGYAFHGSATSFHRDRDRDRALAAAGYRVLRFTWRQLSNEPEACLAALCAALWTRA